MVNFVEVDTFEKFLKKIKNETNPKDFNFSITKPIAIVGETYMPIDVYGKIETLRLVIYYDSIEDAFGYSGNDTNQKLIKLNYTQLEELYRSKVVPFIKSN